jgi:hypothetical protein
MLRPIIATTEEDESVLRNLMNAQLLPNPADGVIHCAVM